MEKNQIDLSEYLCTIVKPTEEELKAFFQIVSFQKMDKNKRLFSVNGFCDKIFFIINGFVKYLMPFHEKEIVVHISSKGDLVTDFFSYFTSKPSTTSAYTITECTLAVAKKSDLENLYAQYKVWERFGRLVAEQAAVNQIVERIKFQTQSKEELYSNLILENPELLQHVKLGDLAQTLGITQETLSRIRNQK
jgi:CRP-like cAMP-binding protein